MPAPVSMPRLLVMVLSDLRQQVLDKSFVIFGLVVPFALMWVFSLVFTPLADDLEPITVAVSAPAEDQVAQVIPQTLQEIDPAQLDVRVETATADEVADRVDAGTAGAGIVVPEDFGAALAAGAAPEVVVHWPEDAGVEADVVTSVVDGVLTQLTATSRTAWALDDLGATQEEMGQALGEGVDGPAVSWVAGETADEQLTPSASIVAGQAGFFLLFTVGFGVLGLIVEREWGTLPRLLSMPIPGWWPALSKGLSSFVLGVVATAVLLLAGSLVFDDVALGSPWPIGVLLVAVVAAATSIGFVIAKVARSAEQAGVAQTIVAITLGMSGGSFFRVPSSGTIGTVLEVNPVAALGRGLGITSGGGGVADLTPVLLTMLVFTLAMLLLARVVPGRKDA